MAPIQFPVWGPEKILDVVLADVRINDAADIVIFVFFFLKKTGVVFFFITKLFVVNSFDLVCAIGIHDGHAGFFGFVFGAGGFFFLFVIVVGGDDQRRFLDFGFLGLFGVGILRILVLILIILV